MPNITRGASMYGLIRYLAGNGKHNEHIEAHLVAGDPAVMAWHDDAQLDAGAALQISKDLDRPRLAFGTRISLPAKSNDGSLARSQHTGKPLRRDAHVWHCSLSLRADEPPLSEEHWAAISEEFVAHMGFAQPSSHQRAAVARILNEPAAGLFHQVGAGKTAEMVISCMQLRRLGMVSKPAVVVPNHMLEQFSREWLQLYPQTRLLAAGSEDLAGPRRRTFVARVATNDWDAVLLTRSAFERLPVPPQVEADYIRRESEQLRAMLLNAKGGEGLTVKRLEKQLLRRQEALQKRLDGKVDPGITFEQTGIDYLVIDEAHDYKNLATQSNIRDAAVDGSNRASDLHLKTEYLRGAHGHRVITMATATPIANSVTEAHVMARYLRPDLLEQAGVYDFDSWAATFGQTVTEIEMAPSGGGQYRMHTRFARFQNVPEMLKMWHVFADVKTGEDLSLPTPVLWPREDGARAPQTVLIAASPEITAYIAKLGERAEAVRARDFTQRSGT